MSRDLEETLDELGPEYREVVAWLKTSRAPRRPRIVRKLRFSRAAVSSLAAASASIALAFFALFRSEGGRCRAPVEYTAAFGGPGSVEELVKTQNPDGSWSSDFLTRQNAAALGRAAFHRGRTGIAYRKAMRYMKMNGIAALSSEEFDSRFDRALARTK